MQHFLALKYVISLQLNERKMFNGILSLKLVFQISSVTYNNVLIKEFMPRMCPRRTVAHPISSPCEWLGSLL